MQLNVKKLGAKHSADVVADPLHALAISQGVVSKGCTRPGLLIALDKQLGKDPCWACLEDRKICLGRPLVEL